MIDKLIDYCTVKLVLTKISIAKYQTWSAVYLSYPYLDQRKLYLKSFLSRHAHMLDRFQVTSLHCANGPV